MELIKKVHRRVVGGKVENLKRTNCAGDEHKQQLINYQATLFTYLYMF